MGLRISMSNKLPGGARVARRKVKRTWDGKSSECWFSPFSAYQNLSECLLKHRSLRPTLSF